MDITLDLPVSFSDPRDEFRNGFVAAVTHLRAQSRPTEWQIAAALEALGDYRRETKVDVAYPPSLPTFTMADCRTDQRLSPLHRLQHDDIHIRVRRGDVSLEGTVLAAEGAVGLPPPICTKPV
jgi:hypothetical protein